jgi:hypothetical protein
VVSAELPRVRCGWSAGALMYGARGSLCARDAEKCRRSRFSPRRNGAD